MEKSRNFGTEEGRKATGSHRILQACQFDPWRWQNHGPCDPLSAVLPSGDPKLALPRASRLQNESLLSRSVPTIYADSQWRLPNYKAQANSLTILNYSKAFDRVWKKDLLIRTVGKGLSQTFAKWLHDFLSWHRLGCKLMENKAGRYR